MAKGHFNNTKNIIWSDNIKPFKGESHKLFTLLDHCHPPPPLSHIISKNIKRKIEWINSMEKKKENIETNLLLSRLQKFLDLQGGPVL